MLPFMTSQAIALSQVKREPNKSAASGRQSAARPTGKGFWSRLARAMIDSRRRRGEIELRHYRGSHEDSPDK